MWVVTVYLIGPAAQQKTFSYFSAYAYRPGDVVKLPAHGRSSFGLVSTCEPLQHMRQHVRGAHFSLQKIARPGKRLLTSPFLRAAFEVAVVSGSSVGAIVSALVPTDILENFDAFAEVPESAEKQVPHDTATEFIIGSRAARLRQYSEVAREYIARSQSVVIIAPTILESERIAGAIPSARLFHAGMSKKRMRDTWHALAQTRKPAIVVGTPAALALPCLRIGAVILERALARGYERQVRPFVKIRSCAEHLARTSGGPCILGSSIIPVDDAVYAPVPKAANELKLTLVDMRPSTDAAAVHAVHRPVFQILSPYVRNAVLERMVRGDRALLICARKGLSPHTVCMDCGMPVSCSRCGSGLVLHEGRGLQKVSLMDARVRRWFECHYCGLTEKVHILCPTCGSWRLSMGGIGLELVAREARKVFPNTDLLVAADGLDGAPIAKNLLAAVENPQHPLLIATERILPYLAQPVSFAAVVSMDSMLSVPEYTASERALAFIGELRGLVSQELVVQTRLPQHPALVACARNEYAHYYDYELALRKRFHYPPYATFIRFSVSGAPALVASHMQVLMDKLIPYSPQQYAGRPKRATLVREHILIRLPRGLREEHELRRLIRTLPPVIEVRVNPSSLLSD